MPVQRIVYFFHTLVDERKRLRQPELVIAGIIYLLSCRGTGDTILR